MRESLRRLSCWVVIPIKPPPDRKTRLAGALAADARDALVRQMAAHVVGAAQSARGIDEIRFVSASANGLPDGAELLIDPGNGLSAAAAFALARVGTAGARRIVIIAGDLPLVQPRDIDLLTALRADGAALAPDRHGVGTNALSLPLPQAADFRFAFGPDSLARHRTELARLGLDCVEVRSEGLARDVDLPDDLADAAALIADRSVPRRR